MENDRAIIVYRWEDAPENLRALSEHGGDEDWVALIPPRLCDFWVGWAVAGTPFGSAGVQVLEHPEFPGWQVRIGAHA